MKNSNIEKSSCCKKTVKKKNTGFLVGIAYGLIPHIGCIAFILGSIFGVTVLMQFFKPLLMNRYFFHILILISLMFATISSVLYLKKQGLLTLQGAKRKWKYLSGMYGSTIAINLILFMLIFPLLANVSIASPTGATVGVPSSGNSLSLIKLQVDIPCPGHAPLISGELRSITGVEGIQYTFFNYFDVAYDSTKTSKQEMLSLEVFQEYPAIVIDEVIALSESDIKQITQQPAGQPTSTRGCGCGGGSCGGAGSCCGGR